MILVVNPAIHAVAEAHSKQSLVGTSQQMKAIPKIVSGGQTGADRAALDWALRCGVACGGMNPRTKRPKSIEFYLNGKLAESAAGVALRARFPPPRGTPPYHWTLLNFIALLIGLVAGFSLESAEAYQGPTSAAANSLGVSLELEGGAYRMFRDGVDHPTLKIDAWSMDGARHEVRVKFQIEDIFNKPAQSPEDVRITLPSDGKKAERTITFEPGLGYFSLTAKFQSESSEIVRWLDLGVVARPFSGPRPNSFFGSNTSGLKKGMDLELLERIGVKVERAHFAPPVQTQDPNWPLTLPSGQAVALNFSQPDKNWESTKGHGLWVLPVVGYSLAGAGNFDRTDLARKLGMYGPPGDRQRFISTWETILRRYPEITTYEFWNEPWIFGWSWAGTPADYRQLQRDWCAMALRVNPQNTIIAGNSTMFVRDNIEPYPEWWRGFLGGISHHPYTRSVGEESFRAGDNLRSIDDCVLTARQMGLEHAFLTEGGTNFESARPKAEEKPFNNLENASKIVQYYVSAALSGVFMGNAQWGIQPARKVDVELAHWPG